MYQLPKELKLFLENNSDFDFIGIYSKGYDCIYFSKNGDHLNIEYEAMEESHIQYYEKLKNFASENDFKIVEEINKNIPYLKINTNTSLDETFHLAKEIQHTIFGNSDDTKYDIVP